MSIINITNVCVLSNPAPFTSQFSFEITFECHAPGLPSDSSQELEWKLIYVSSAEDQSLDQELDAVLVG
jgi:histone chaperone ASF1